MNKHQAVPCYSLARCEKRQGNNLTSITTRHLIIIVVKQVVKRIVTTFLHNAVELLRVNLAIAIAVSLVNHVLELLLSHVLAELLRDPLEVLEGDLASAIIIKQFEHFEDLLLGVLLTHLPGHHLKEFGEFNLPRAIGIDVGDHLAQLLLLDLKAKSQHRSLQLAVVDRARVIRVEEIECLTDLLHLLLRKSGLLGLTCGSVAAHDILRTAAAW